MTEAAENHTPQPETPANDAGAQTIAALQAELADAKDKMLRALADAENTRKRAERMQLDTSKYAVTGFARDLLDVADNLRRALDAVPAEQRTSNEALNNLLQGVEATERVMLAAFEKHGVRKISPHAGVFDPNVHEVMFEAEVAGKRAGEIIQLVESGYMIADRLLRPARVGVAKGDSSMPSARSLDESV
ncbi:MAG: nucleotide exchange factor GrpE [Alphaproteobacteria bacterium]|nr:nucleotide exchange factor GrpE [Alphaproteobacteria bacterium]